MADRALIDTGALLAVANPRDQYHERAVAIGRRFQARGGRWIGTALVLGEFHGHLIRRIDPNVSAGLMRKLLEDPVYEWQEVSADLIAEALARWIEKFRDQRISLTDAVSFEVMRRSRLAKAFTFDRHFATAGFEALD